MTKKWVNIDFVVSRNALVARIHDIECASSHGISTARADCRSWILSKQKQAGDFWWKKIINLELLLKQDPSLVWEVDLNQRKILVFSKNGFVRAF